MKKTLPTSDKDISNAYMYIELQKAGMKHTEILSALIAHNGVYSASIADHVAAVKADHDEFIQNKYSNMMQEHDINEFQKDVGKVPALQKFANWFHSIVHSLDDGSFEVLLFKNEQDYEEQTPSQVVKLDEKLHVAASLNEEDLAIEDLKKEISKLKSVSLSNIIFSHVSDGLELSDEERTEFNQMLGKAFADLCTVVAVHPKDKGKPEKKLHKIRTTDLNDYAEVAGTGITQHVIRNAEKAGLAKEVVEAVEEALVAASNRQFQKWEYKRGEEGVHWGKGSESHAEFANYVTSDHIAATADKLLEDLHDMDLDTAPMAQQAYKYALNLFTKDIINFIQKSGPAAYKENVENWHMKLWDEAMKEDKSEFDDAAASAIANNEVNLDATYYYYSADIKYDENGEVLHDAIGGGYFLSKKEAYKYYDEHGIPAKDIEEMELGWHGKAEPHTTEYDEIIEFRTQFMDEEMPEEESEED